MRESFLLFVASALWSLLIGIIGFLSIRTLKQITDDLKDLRKDHNRLSEDFYQLRGEHYVHHGRRASDVDQHLISEE